MRNARDWAKEKREGLISAANTKVLDQDHSGLDSSMRSFVSLSSSEPTHPESETSADELALDVNILATSSHRITAGTQKKSQLKSSSNRYLKRNKGSEINRRPGMGSGCPQVI